MTVIYGKKLNVDFLPYIDKKYTQGKSVVLYSGKDVFLQIFVRLEIDKTYHYIFAICKVLTTQRQIISRQNVRSYIQGITYLRNALKSLGFCHMSAACQGNRISQLNASLCPSSATYIVHILDNLWVLYSQNLFDENYSDTHFLNSLEFSFAPNFKCVFIKTDSNS